MRNIILEWSILISQEAYVYKTYVGSLMTSFLFFSSGTERREKRKIYSKEFSN